MIDGLLKILREKKPLVHHITNMVTINDCANMTLAIGGLPVMAHAIEEVEEMVSAAQALVLNIGTLTGEQVEAMIKAGKTANSLMIPVILDPVGAGATELRTNAARRILNQIKIAVIKGNRAEMGILAGTGGKIRGVESEEEHGDIDVYKRFAIENDCIVAVSGATDIITDGVKAAYVDNGHPMMGTITGTGCMLSSVVGCFCGAVSDYFDATVAAFAAFGLAGELAAARPDVKGPASFKQAFFDEIYGITDEKIKIGMKVSMEGEAS